MSKIEIEFGNKKYALSKLEYHVYEDRHVILASNPAQRLANIYQFQLKIPEDANLKELVQMITELRDQFREFIFSGSSCGYIKPFFKTKPVGTLSYQRALF